MRRVTVTIPDELEQALLEYQAAQDVPPTWTAILQTALRDFLVERDPLTVRGYRPPRKPYRFTPAEPGSGRSDISVTKDRLPEHVATG